MKTISTMFFDNKLKILKHEFDIKKMFDFLTSQIIIIINVIILWTIKNFENDYKKIKIFNSNSIMNNKNVFCWFLIFHILLFIKHYERIKVIWKNIFHKIRYVIILFQLRKKTIIMNKWQQNNDELNKKN